MLSVARVLNDHYVVIKVDREERPDIDHIYMTVCQAMTGQGGWPLTIIMTPDKKPFFAGTYFPKEDRWGRPGLLTVLEQIKNAWTMNPVRLLEVGEQVTRAIQNRPVELVGEPTKDILEKGFEQLRDHFDPIFGGFGEAPKFPAPHQLMFLLRYYKQSLERQALQMVEKTLTSMYKGGIYDHLGFGFSRYSTDEQWLIPHFEKMLYDNALLAIIFSSVTYVYMLQTGKNVITNIIQTADTTDDKSQNTTFTVVGFFTPTKPVFTAALVDPGRPVKVQSFSGVSPEFWKPVKEPNYTVIRGTDLTVTFREQSQWSMRSLAFYQDTEGVLNGLVATLDLESNRLIGRVRNNTSLALEHVTLLLGNDYRCLGNLACGQEKQVSLPLPAPPTYNPRQPSSRPGYFPVWQIFVYPDGKEEVLKAFRHLKGPAVSYPPPDYYGPPPRRLNVEEQRRANILENWLNNKYRHGSGAELQSSWPLTLIAFSQEPLSEVKIKDLRAKPQYLSVILRKPKLVLPKGNFLIPAGLVIPEVIGPSMGGIFGHNNLFGLDRGSLTYVFRPGLPEGTKIKEITVNLPYFPGIPLPGKPGKFKDGPMGPPSPSPTPVEPGALEIYNPWRGLWQELTGTSLFRLGAEYALPGGEVRLRVNGFSQNSKKFFYFLPPTVAYQGVRE
ncbi:MAG TPA: hypothetical protein DHV84_05340 [Desulfotomaculum sp.]|nr:hypothetical protein [Desulfotomaculum sp.]